MHGAWIDLLWPVKLLLLSVSWFGNDIIALWNKNCGGVIKVKRVQTCINLCCSVTDRLLIFLNCWVVPINGVKRLNSVALCSNQMAPNKNQAEKLSLVQFYTQALIKLHCIFQQEIFTQQINTKILYFQYMFMLHTIRKIILLLLPKSNIGAILNPLNNLRKTATLNTGTSG